MSDVERIVTQIHDALTGALKLELADRQALAQQQSRWRASSIWRSSLSATIATCCSAKRAERPFD
jgi:hypothetical protein